MLVCHLEHGTKYLQGDVMRSVGFEGLDGVWVVEYRSHVLSNLRFLQLVVEGLLSTPGVGAAF